MHDSSYLERRSEIETYFDRTAADTWARLTSDAPVGRIRQTVREGRDQMRATLLDWLPQDLSGRRLLDAGCGTGLVGEILHGLGYAHVDTGAMYRALAAVGRGAEIRSSRVITPLRGRPP